MTEGWECGAESNGYDSLFHKPGILVVVRLVPEISGWFIANAGRQSVAPCRWTNRRSGRPGMNRDEDNRAQQFDERERLSRPDMAKPSRC